MPYALALTVTIAPREGGAPNPTSYDPVTVTGDPAAGAVVCDALVVSWSRTSGRDHQDAGSITVGLLSPVYPDPVDSLATDGALVTVTTAAGVVVTRGWISEARYALVDVAGLGRRRRWSLTLDDVVAYAGRWKAGTFSWPTKTEDDRVTTINSQTLDHLMVSYAGTGDSYGPRDVNNDSVLDLARLTCRPWLTMTETDAGMKARDRQGMQVFWTSYGSAAYTDPSNGLPTPVPASALSDAPRRRSRAERLTSCTATHYVTPAAPVKYTGTKNAPNAPARFADWSVESDYISTMGAGLHPQVAALFDSELKAAQWPRWRLDGSVTLYPDALSSTAILDALVNINTRPLVTMKLSGQPEDVDPVQRVIGGRLTITYTPDEGVHLEPVELDLEPAELAGVRPARWSDFPGSTAAYPQTFALMGTVTIGALDSVVNI